MKPLTAVHFGARADDDRPLLVVGPSLGTSVRTLWQACAERLEDQFAVLGWQLPGHGGAPTDDGFTVAELAGAVLHLIDASHPSAPGQPLRSFYLAGDSFGAAVALQLCLDVPDRVIALAVCCTGAKIGESEAWLERARAVRADGVSVLLPETPARWFAPGFAERIPDVAGLLLEELARVDRDGYAAACLALADFDVRNRLAELGAPLLAIAGAQDTVTPPPLLAALATGVASGRLIVLPDVAHLAPAEAPQDVADLLRGLPVLARLASADATVGRVRAEGMRVRREVLGDEHVDRANARTDEFTADFQAFITQYAWGSVWTRDGLDRRSRSLITLTALVARGHSEELAMHVRAARRNGLTKTELAELFLQTAIYCGVPDANSAFRIAQKVLAEEADGRDPGGANQQR